MRIKFFDYVTTMDTYGKVKSKLSNMPNIPLAHSICGIRYIPIGLKGTFIMEKKI